MSATCGWIQADKINQGRSVDSPAFKDVKYVLRTREAGSLRADDVGKTVTLTGWGDRRRGPGGGA
ncbi:MAG: hypothetical protein FWG25_10670, partial [Promicromonosporaceae bacterium]|nr:hypothetical protein [Promicromonosporaceae bacterium]